jgi:uncharacterized protein YjcR
MENMGRPRNPERDKSLQRYIDSGGNISTEELAAAAGVPAARIRKWKSEDKWEEKLHNTPKKRGGQKGNKNAAGKTPRKEGNKNAVTHGAFAQAGYEDISPEEAKEIREKQGNSLTHMMEELQALYVRKAYLESLLDKYTSPDKQETFYTDKIVQMIVPKTMEEKLQEWNTGETTGVAEDPDHSKSSAPEQFKTAMKSIIKASAFDRAMKVEAELNRLHGRIIKQLDSIKAYELEDRRLSLEEKRYTLAKQKLTGAYDIDPETGDIIDEPEEDEQSI